MLIQLKLLTIIRRENNNNKDNDDYVTNRADYNIATINSIKNNNAKG